jgi:hypothetical protein
MQVSLPEPRAPLLKPNSSCTCFLLPSQPLAQNGEKRVFLSEVVELPPAFDRFVVLVLACLSSCIATRQ